MTNANSILGATAHQLQERLNAGELTSVELVQAFTAQIHRHNHQGLKLNAILSVCPPDIALQQAEKLDQERRGGKVRGKLHGIPITVKDAIMTGPELGMPTTAGSFVFASMTAKKNATLIDRLIEAGAIILGKANLTEFCGLKSNDTPIGWSAYGGQTLSPYRREDLDESEQPTAGGSSSGSCAGLAAGFSTLSIGTETSGSTVYPASVCGLYGIKLTVGSVPTDGVFTLSYSYDGIGAFARDPWDLAELVDALSAPETSRAELLANLYPPGHGSEKIWQNFSIGATKVHWGLHEQAIKGKWDLPELMANYKYVVDKLASEGAKVAYPLESPEAESIKYDGEALHTVAYHEFPGRVAEFISAFEYNPQVTNLEGVIEWNKEHADKAMPAPYTTQTELIASLNNNMAPERHDAAAKDLRRQAGEDGMAKIMDEQGVDIILTASDSTLVSFAAYTGWTIGTVPLSNLPTNDQPYGLFVMAREGREDLLLSFMAAFAKTFPPVKRPAPAVIG